MSTNYTNEERDRLLQELLELHFGCHPQPELLERRLGEEPELQELQRQALQQARLLEQAAKPDQPALRLEQPPPKAARRRWYALPSRRMAIAAATAAAMVGVAAGNWGLASWRLSSQETAHLQLTVSAPQAVPAGAPWSVTVQSATLQGAAAPCNVSWHTYDAAGNELAHGEQPSPGTITLAMPASMTIPQRIEVTASTPTDRQQQLLQLTSAATPPLVHLSTDRPVYRPGEPIYVRAVVLDRLSLQAQPDAQQGQPMRVRVLDPKGAPALDQRDVTVQRDPVRGQVGALCWTVPAAATGGTWQLEVSSPQGSFPPERLPFVVMEFQPPRLQKTLVLDRKTYAPGEQGTAELKVLRMGGGVAAGATVRAGLVIDGSEVWHADGALDAGGRCLFRFAVPQQVEAGAARFLARVTDGVVVESELKPFVVPTGKVEVACYPEGGELLAGVENRVYLQCADPLGRPVDGEGRIRAADGGVVATFRTVHQGRATCAFTPIAGVAYAAEVDGKQGSFALTAAVERGVALRALDDGIAAGAPLRLTVAGNGDGPWLVAAFCRGVLLGQTTVRPSADGAVATPVELPLPPQAAGVLRVTVFDRSMRPVAERLLRRAAAQRLDVVLTPLAAKVAPGGSQSIGVQTRDERGNPVAAVVGLTVTDRAALAMGDEPAIALQDQQLLFADTERVEDLGDFLASGEHAARNADLLLGTRGWRRFVWRDDAAAKAAIAAHGPWAEGLLAREGFSQTPQVASSGDEARAALAAPDRAVWRDRRLLESILGLSLLALALLLLFELGALLPRLRRGGWQPQVLGGVSAVLVVGAALVLWMPLATARLEMLAPEGAARVHEFEVWDAAPARLLRFEAFDLDGVAADPATVADEFFLGAGMVRDDRALLRAKGRAAPAVAAPGPAGPASPGPGWQVAPGGPPGSRWTGVMPFREYAHRRSGDATRADFTETVYWHPLLLTDANGEASVTFDVSDAVTTWAARADAHGNGRVGSGTSTFVSVLPFHLEAKLPAEMSAGDELLLPVAFTLEDGDGKQAEMRARVDGSLSIPAGKNLARVALQDGRGRYLLPVTAAAGAGSATLHLVGSAVRFQDLVEQKIRVVPRGFPHRQSWGGTASAKTAASATVAIPGDLAPGSGQLVFKLFPSPLASLGEGLEGILREPCGCFEQASSSNYPNTLVLSYLQASGDDIPSVANRARELLPKGYQKITGYECSERGYEWFGGNPGHEALSAYGLLEFQDMGKVHDVDTAMVARTRSWLMSRRDGKGGFQRNSKALDSFGRAPQSVTGPYIVYALLYSGTAAGELQPELDALAARAVTTADAYELALEACALHEGKRPEAAAARARLAALQQPDGSLRGSTTSITSSGGKDLTVETTAFAVLAWLSDAAFAAKARAGVDYLQTQKTASGTFGATQATICALRALVAYAQHSRKMPEAGTVRIVDTTADKVLAERAFAAGQPDAVTLDLIDALAAGQHDLRIELQGGGEGGLPWAMDLAYHSDRPADDADAAVGIATALRSAVVEEGRSVAVDVTVDNRTQQAQPMTLAIVGLPAGLEVTTKVLDDLQRGGAFDLWELRGRELVLYWRGLPAAAKKTVTLDLLARIPGTSTGPASRSYLYYTPSQKRWAAPLVVRVTPVASTPR